MVDTAVVSRPFCALGRSALHDLERLHRDVIEKGCAEWNTAGSIPRGEYEKTFAGAAVLGEEIAALKSAVDDQERWSAHRYILTRYVPGAVADALMATYTKEDDNG